LLLKGRLGGLQALVSEGSGQGPDLRRLGALLALRHFEFHALGFGQGLEPGALDFAEVGEEVLAAVVRGNEAEALAFVEPLHGASFGCHINFLSSETPARADAVQKRQKNT
jgi:hypothetical protein